MAESAKEHSREQSDEPLLDIEAGVDLSEPSAYSLKCTWSEIV